MTTIIMGILLLSFVSAYTFTPAEDKRYVTSTHTFSNEETEIYKFQSHLDYCNMTCKVSEWEDYVNKDMDRYIINYEYKIANPDENKEVTINDEVIKQEEYTDDTSWIVGMIKKLVEKFESLFTRTSYLEDELCKKDSSYGFCEVIK